MPTHLKPRFNISYHHKTFQIKQQIYQRPNCSVNTVHREEKNTHLFEFNLDAHICVFESGKYTIMLMV